MARGVWKNGLLKIFLTRSSLGCLFRPLLYSREEAMHFALLEPFAMLTGKIIELPGYWERSLIYYWMIEIPQTLLEELFFSDEQGRRICFLLDEADPAAAVDIACITQGYVWNYLDRLLQTDSDFYNKFGMNALDLHNLICSLIGPENSILFYQQEFSDIVANTNELTRGKTQQIFFKNVFSDLKSTVSDKQMSDCMAFCLWKMNNARYLSLTMFDAIKQGESVGVKAMSRLI